MAKRNFKQQPKRSNTADHVNAKEITSTPTTASVTVPTISQTITTPIHVAFRDFIKLADINTINTFLATATFTLESENLEVLWKRAYEEGYKNGRKAVLQDLGGKLEEKFEEGVARGMDLGREEGYTVAKKGFDGIVKALRAREAQKSSTADTSAQTDPPAITTTPIFVQTDVPTIPTLNDMSPSPTFSPHTTPSPSSTPANTQNEYPDHPEPAKSPISERFNWADDIDSSPRTCTTPTKHPRDLSGLRSLTTNPFSSLKRRRRYPQTRNSYRKQSQLCQKHFYPYHHHPSPPYWHPTHYLSQPASVSLDWDQDPRLADLGTALRALGWIRAC
jgi:hypothetical protein